MARVRKSPRKAAILNFFFYGIGYVYLGRKWGWGIFAATILYSIIVMAGTDGDFELFLLINLFDIPVGIVLAWHAYRMAKRMDVLGLTQDIKPMEEEKEEVNLRCPSCGNEVRQEDRFCSNCGQPLSKKSDESIKRRGKRIGKKGLILSIVILTILIWNAIQLWVFYSLSFNFYISDFSVNTLLMLPTGVSLQYTIEAYNPTGIGVYIPEINGNVYLEGVYVDDFVINEQYVFPHGFAYQDLWIDVDVNDLPAITSALKSILTKGSVTVTIYGDARVRLSLLPLVEIPYYVHIPFQMEGVYRLGG
jgi:predicted nucleic acid-binding Zn ribbon protein